MENDTPPTPTPSGKTMGDAWHELFSNLGCMGILIVLGLMGGCFTPLITAITSCKN